YAPDDYGNSIATASILPIVNGSSNLAGLIGRNDDRDVLKFTTGGGPGSFTLGGAQYGGGLGGLLGPQTASGNTLVISNPTNPLAASLSSTPAAGTYYLVVHSTGGYGNLGRYT